MNYRKFAVLGLKCVVAATLLVGSVVASSQAAPGFLEKIEVFKAGDGGVTLYRIPGVVVTTNGTVIVYCEARKNSNSDWAESEIYLRRSTDGGKTWSEPKSIAHKGERLPRNPVAVTLKKGKDSDQTVNNPVAIVDRQTGAIHFLYCINYQRCFYMWSDDDGVTFTKPVEIAEAFEGFKPAYQFNIIATGPGHGIQLKNGRLVVPVWLSTGAKGHGPSVAATIYSDDNGKTWKNGEIAAPGTAEWADPNETAAVELADGRVMLNTRSASKPNRRLITISPDGATKWTKPYFDEGLVEPVCMAGLVRLSTMPSSNTNRILFSNPDNLESSKGDLKPGSHRDRKNLTVKLSYDEAKNWQVKKTLEAGPSAYSDLAVLPDGTILCFYERQKLLTVARFNLEWLTDGKDTLAK